MLYTQDVDIGDQPWYREGSTEISLCHLRLRRKESSPCESPGSGTQGSALPAAALCLLSPAVNSSRALQQILASSRPLNSSSLNGHTGNPTSEAAVHQLSCKGMPQGPCQHSQVGACSCAFRAQLSNHESIMPGHPCLRSNFCLTSSPWIRVRMVSNFISGR